jgi:hypothetical protein
MTETFLHIDLLEKVGDEQNSHSGNSSGCPPLLDRFLESLEVILESIMARPLSEWILGL